MSTPTAAVTWREVAARVGRDVAGPAADAVDREARFPHETFAALRLTPGEPELAIYHMEEYTEENIDTEAAVGVDEATRRRLAGGPLQVRELAATPMVASLVHHGPAMDITAAVTSLFRWLGANQLASAGPLREAHLDFRESAHDFNFPVTVELQLPVAE